MRGLQKRRLSKRKLSDGIALLVGSTKEELYGNGVWAGNTEMPHNTGTGRSDRAVLRTLVKRNPNKGLLKPTLPAR
jgi:hypothetical protein